MNALPLIIKDETESLGVNQPIDDSIAKALTRFNSALIEKFNVFDDNIRNIDKKVETTVKIITPKRKGLLDWIKSAEKNTAVLKELEAEDTNDEYIKAGFEMMSMLTANVSSIASIMLLIVPFLANQLQQGEGNMMTGETVEQEFEEPGKVLPTLPGEAVRERTPVQRMKGKREEQRSAAKAPVPSDLTTVFEFTARTGDKEHFSGLESNFKTDLIQMAIEYHEKTKRKIIINSAARSYKEQENFYMLWKSGKGNRAAKPGTSLHEKGMAVDIPSYQIQELQQRGLLKKHGFKGGNVAGEGWHLERAYGNFQALENSVKPLSSDEKRSLVASVPVTTVASPTIARFDNLVRKSEKAKKVTHVEPKRMIVQTPVKTHIDNGKTVFVEEYDGEIMDETFNRSNSLLA